MGGAERREIVVATYNVHGFVGSDGSRDPERVFRVIEQLDADAVALQEVQALPEELATFEAMVRDAGYELLPGWTLSRRGADFGNALVTRLRVDGLLRHDVSVDGREPRVALDARVRLGGASLRLMAVHLGLRAAERRAQISALAQRLDGGADSGAPQLSVLLGDFNEWNPRSRRLEPLARRVGPFSRCATFPSRLPVFALDRIAVGPPHCLLEVRALAGPLARQASDHLPLRARMRVPSCPRDLTSPPQRRGHENHRPRVERTGR